jgi:hypothetical protein
MHTVNKQELEMAYVNQELKAKLAPKIRAICKKHGVKATLAVRNHSTLVLNIRQGSIDFFESFNRLGSQESRPAHLPFRPVDKSIDVNCYHYRSHFDGKALKFLSEVIPAMNAGNHDNSDIQVDYFDVGWYIDVNIGRWNQPYALVK